MMLATTLASARDIALITNKTNGVSAVTLPDLVKLSRVETDRWPDGKSVTVVLRSPDSPEMKLVLAKVYGMSAKELDALIVTSNQTRPSHRAMLVVNSDEELVNTVASIPGAIGVVDVYSINSGVNVIKLAGKLPLEPGYLLHGN